MKHFTPGKTTATMNESSLLDLKAKPSSPVGSNLAKDYSTRFAFVERAGMDLGAVFQSLESSVGRVKAEQFLTGLREALIAPDKEIKQGGTANCWFVDRMADLAAKDPNRFAAIMLDAALKGEIKPEHFAAEEQFHLDRGFGSRTVFQRVSQRWYLGKMGVQEGIATEDLMKRSDKFLLGREQLVLASDRYNPSGVNVRGLFSTSPELIVGSGAVLHWADSKDGENELHVYHRVVVTKIENGTVYFREGVKSDHMNAPDGFQLRRMPDGSILGSLPLEVFSQRVVGLVADRERAEALGVKESYYNQKITFYPWQIEPGLMTHKKVVPFIPSEESEYYRYLKKVRKEEEGGHPISTQPPLPESERRALPLNSLNATPGKKTA